MNILPDYLIQYLPALEEVMEELRLSVLDHAYELLKRLDIDELSTDEIRQKLELCDLKVDNMVKEWLPNGRFYRMYPSIKHHRARQNAIKAIAKSGGQFEGLWTDDFSNKTEYNFNKIQVARHYELSQDADGYFYVSGDIKKDASGRIISSAATALTTDILINQSLPAGYTYLYVPWPRPVYPGDSGYFYNVHMLMYDRLFYAFDCDHKWVFIKEDSIGSYYHCADNSPSNSYCKIDSTSIIEYGDSANNCNHLFDATAEGDIPFYKNRMADFSTPASTIYDWSNGNGTPYRTPYWLDYHYMNYSKHTEPVTSGDNKTAGTWPIHEQGLYYDAEGFPVVDPSDAVQYVLNKECEELSDSNSTFKTNCYLHSKNKTTTPNRSQKFSPKELIVNDEIKSFEYSIDAHNFIEYNYINGEPVSLDDDKYPEFAGPYRWDLVTPGYSYHTRESLHHIKTYKPFWNESSPLYAWMQSIDDSSNNHSLYYWMHLDQENSIPNINYNADPNSEGNKNLIPDVNYRNSFVEGIRRDNVPPISDVTFGSYRRNTICQFSRDPIYVGYFAGDNSNLNSSVEQGSNVELSTDRPEENIFYVIGSGTPVNNEIESQYNLVSLNYIDSDGLQIETKSDLSYIEAEPFSGLLFLNLNGFEESIGNSDNKYNYLLYKKLDRHILYVSPDKSAKSLQYWYNTLYNDVGSSEIYFFDNSDSSYISALNNQSLKFTILGVHTSDGKFVNVEDESAYILLTYYEDNQSEHTYKYSLTVSKIVDKNNVPLNVKDIVFNAVLDSSATEECTPETVIAISPDNESIEVTRLKNDSLNIDFIDLGDGYITIDEFYEMGYSFPPTPPEPSIKFVMGGTLSLTNEGATLFEETDGNNLLSIGVRLIETVKETGLLTVDE